MTSPSHEKDSYNCIGMLIRRIHAKYCLRVAFAMQNVALKNRICPSKLHPGKLIWPWKTNHLKMYLLLNMVIFHCCHSFSRGCTILLGWHNWHRSVWMTHRTKTRLTHHPCRWLLWDMTCAKTAQQTAIDQGWVGLAFVASQILETLNILKVPRCKIGSWTLHFIGTKMQNVKTCIIESKCGQINLVSLLNCLSIRGPGPKCLGFLRRVVVHDYPRGPGDDMVVFQGNESWMSLGFFCCWAHAKKTSGKENLLLDYCLHIYIT